MIARPTRRFASVVRTVPLPASTTSWVWLMGDGRPQTTATADSPSDAAELLAEVDTDAVSVVEIRDRRAFCEVRADTERRVDRPARRGNGLPNLWAGIVPLDGVTDLPSTPISQGDYLGWVQIFASDPSAEVSGDFPSPLSLPLGRYGMVSADA